MKAIGAPDDPLEAQQGDRLSVVDGAPSPQDAPSFNGLDPSTSTAERETAGSFRRRRRFTQEIRRHDKVERLRRFLTVLALGVAIVGVSVALGQKSSEVQFPASGRP